MRVWSWREAIQKSNLHPTTRHVLLNLSIHMNDLGEGAFPSTATQAKCTGLSERTICTHLEHACAAGFLVKEKHGFGGQKWARNEYRAAYPEMQKGTEPDDIETGKGTEPDDIETGKGTEPDDIKALKEVQSNSPLELSIQKEVTNVTSKKTEEEIELRKTFDTHFWPNYPKQRAGSKDKAWLAFKKAVTRDTVQRILMGLSRYADSDEVARGFAKGAQAWLNDDRWKNQYQPAGGTHAQPKDFTTAAEQLARRYLGEQDQPPIIDAEYEVHPS